MTTEFVLTCGACRTSHHLTGDAAVAAAEIATFVAAHRGHDNFRVETESASSDADAAE